MTRAIAFEESGERSCLCEYDVKVCSKSLLFAGSISWKIGIFPVLSASWKSNNVGTSGLITLGTELVAE